MGRRLPQPYRFRIPSTNVESPEPKGRLSSSFPLDSGHQLWCSWTSKNIPSAPVMLHQLKRDIWCICLELKCVVDLIDPPQPQAVLSRRQG
jgi:hypothetical protein